MHSYLISLAVGILVGVLYGLLGVRSPAPPTVALIGLLGMLIGEQAVPAIKARIGHSSPKSPEAHSARKNDSPEQKEAS